MEGSGETAQERHDRLIIERCEEAVQLYGRKKCAELQVEVIMKLTRFYISAGNTQMANEKLTEAYALGESLPALSRVHLFNSIGLTYRQMGYRRKFLFYLRESAAIYKDNFNLAAAHCLLGITAQELLMPHLNPQLEYQAEGVRAQKGLLKASPISPQLYGWAYLQLQILACSYPRLPAKRKGRDSSRFHF